MIKFSLLIALGLSLPLIGADNPSTVENSYQIGFSYWNDNFAYQRQISSLVPPGDDDFMTGSWHLEVLKVRQSVLKGLELYYAIFTNRSENNRFDLLAGRWFREFKHEEWSIKLATGGLIRGNLGGGKIQNSYHDYLGYDRVELSYLENSRFGILLYGRVARPLMKMNNTVVDGYGTGSLRIGAGPTNFRMGVESTSRWSLPGVPLTWTLISRLGYAHYLHPSAVIQPYFSHGLVAGLLIGIELKGSYGLNLWFTENQYGLQDPHYGITLSYGSGALIPPRLYSIMFP